MTPVNSFLVTHDFSLLVFHYRVVDFTYLSVSETKNIGLL